MLSELIVGLIMVAPNGGLFEGAVHPLDLTVRPGMVRLGEAVFDPVLAAVRSNMCNHTGPSAGTPWGHIGELYPIVRQYRVDGVGHGFNQRVQEADR